MCVLVILFLCRYTYINKLFWICKEEVLHMRSEIYYFSGTGNCLAIARQINERLIEKGRVIPITAIDGKLTVEADRVGFVFPVYYHKVPDFVKQFILNMEFTTAPYIYAVATHNGAIGQSLFDVKALLAKKGQSLSLGCTIAMPGNAFVTPPDIELERLAAAEQEVKEIAGLIERQEEGAIAGHKGLIEQIRNAVVSFAAKHYGFAPKRFKVSDDCTGCKRCEKLCPVNSICLLDGKPEWKKKCTACLACFHWCPEEAIYLDNPYIGKRRKYRHPDIGVEDMMDAQRSL